MRNCPKRNPRKPNEIDKFQLSASVYSLLYFRLPHLFCISCMKPICTIFSICFQAFCRNSGLQPKFRQARKL